MTFARPLFILLVPVALAAGVALSGRISRRRALRATLRALALAAVAAALAGPQLAAVAPGTRVELLDVSASFRARRAIGEGFLGELAEAVARETKPGERFRTVRVPFADGVGPGARPGATDLPAAIRAAAAIAGTGGDVVLVSDGLSTEPGALEAAREAGALGVAIHVHLPEDPGLPSLAIADVRAPVRLRPGEPFVAEVAVVWNGRAAPPGESPPARHREARVLIARGGDVLAEAPLELPDGGGSAIARLELAPERVRSLAGAGLVRLEIEVRSALAGDPLPEAARAEAAFVVDGRPRVLAVGAAPPLAGFDVVRARPEDVPGTAAELAPFAAVLLADVPAEALGPRRMAALDAYVAAGGGLLALGARRAFGPGGYADSPLERALPVLSNPPAQSGERLALAVLLDCSGSMNEAAEPGRSKFAAACAAVEAALERLSPRDRVAIFLFSTKVEEALPLMPARDAAQVRAALAPVQPDGGTDVFPAIEAGLEAVAAADAERRHVAIVTDGRSDATADEAAGLARIEAFRAQRRDVTLSVVAVGDDVDERLLAAIARAGGGRFERAGPHALEDVIARELDPRREELVVEGPLAVRALEEGFVAGAPPHVAEAVRVAAKPGARVVLEAADLPLLILGPSGGGRGAAFASADAAPLVEAIARAVREVARPESLPGLTFRAMAAGAALRLEADAREPDGRFRRGLSLVGRIAGGGAARLVEVAPGLYRGEVARPAEPLLVSLFGDDSRPLATAVFVPPRPLEYAPAPPDRALLRAIAETTGGRWLERGATPPAAPHGRGGARPIAALLALLAAALFFADLVAEAAALNRPSGRRSRKSATRT